MAHATRIASARTAAPHPAQRDPHTLRVGETVFRLTEVASYEIEERLERDWDGQWLCAIGYGAAAMLIFISILLGMDGKFAIAVVFLAGIAAMSLGDAAAVRPVTTYWLHVALMDGRRASFVDADLRVVEEIARRIDRVRGRSS
jgi:hypothetical protein